MWAKGPSRPVTCLLKEEKKVVYMIGAQRMFITDEETKL